MAVPLILGALPPMGRADAQGCVREGVVQCIRSRS